MLPTPDEVKRMERDAAEAELRRVLRKKQHEYEQWRNKKQCIHRNIKDQLARGMKGKWFPIRYQYTYPDGNEYSDNYRKYERDEITKDWNEAGWYVEIKRGFLLAWLIRLVPMNTKEVIPAEV